MPTTFGKTLTPQQIADLVAFLTSSPDAAAACPDFPRGVRAIALRPRPHADRRGRRAPAADAGRDRRGARRRDPRRVVVTGRMFQSVRRYALGRPGSPTRSSATRARSSPTRSPASSCGTCRCREPEAREVIAAVEDARLHAQLSTSTTSCTWPSETPESDAYAGFQHLESSTRSATCSPGSPSRRRSSSSSATRTSSTASRSRCRRASAAGSTSPSRSPHFLEFASPAVHEGLGARLPRRAARLHARAVGRVRRRRERRRAARVGRLRRRGRERAPAGAGGRRLRLPVRGRGRRGPGDRGSGGAYC